MRSINNSPTMASDGIETVLRRMILNLELEPGANFSEARLAKMLDCGRTPLREALHRLNEQGLVVHSPGRGFSVAPLDVFDFAESMDALAQMAGIAAPSAVEWLTPDDLDRLQQVVSRARDLDEQKDHATIGELDLEFHILLASASRNRQLARFLTRLHRIVVRYTTYSWRRGWQADPSLDEHEHIIEALRQRDAREVERRLREHIVNAKTRVVGYLSQVDA